MTKRNRDPDLDIFGPDSVIAPTESSISMKLRQYWPFFRPGRPGELRQASTIEAKVAKHHGPHNDAKIEWWYVNGHIGPDAARSEFSFFAAFFRLVADTVDPGEEDRTYVHALNWAIIDRKNGGAPVAQGFKTGQTKSKGYYPFSCMDPIAPRVVLDLISSNMYHGDPLLIKSLTEILQENQVPLPDTIMASKAEVTSNKLVYDGSSFEIVPGPPKAADAGPDEPTPSPSFKLVLSGTQPPEDATAAAGAASSSASSRKIEIELCLKPNQGPVLHGKDGVVSLGSKVDDMFYYFYPSCDVTEFRVKECDEATFPFAARLKAAAAQVADLPVQGRGWVDHEFGGAIPSTIEEFQFIFAQTVEKRSGMEHAWEWAAILLENGIKLSVTSLIDPVKMDDAVTKGVVERFAIVLHPTGEFERVESDKVTFSPTATWKSPVTSAVFPVAWQVKVELAKGGVLDFTLDAGDIKDQELVTLAAKPSFWEGFAGAKGTYTAPGGAAPVAFTGEATLECHGETDLNAVGKSVDQLHSILFAPLQMTIAKEPLSDTKITKAYLDLLQGKVRPNIEMAATMLAAMAPDQPPMTSEQKDVLCSLAAAFVASAHHGAATIKSEDDFVEQIENHVETMWAAQSSKMLVDYKRILLRTFVLRELQECRKNCPALSAATSAVNRGGDDATPAPAVGAGMIDGAKVLSTLTPCYNLPKDQLYPIPTLAELKAGSRVKDTAVAEHLFTGTWLKDWTHSDKFNDLLSAQNVSFMYRKLIDQLTPKMVTEVHPRFFRSNVTTSMSDDMMQDMIDGTQYKWPSSGRGEMTSRSMLLHGGQLLYTQSILPTKAQNLKDEATGEPLMEHKWIHHTKDEGVMVQRTCYGPHTADSYFKKQE